MKKSRMISVAIAFFLFVSGYGIALGQTDSTKPAGPPTAAEHTDHAGHGAAQPSDKPAGHAGHDMSHAGMDDMKRQEDAMAAHMKGMHTLMEKISATANPAERKQLMAEHVTMMARGMKMMREMDDTMMMGMMGNMPMCHTMMQKKAERNYAMMEQIIESQKQLLQLAP
jgi:hypothetical protein